MTRRQGGGRVPRGISGSLTLAVVSVVVLAFIFLVDGEVVGANKFAGSPSFRMHQQQQRSDVRMMIGNNNRPHLVSEEHPQSAAAPTTLPPWGYVSVKDFNATGDGVTDDTNAFQNALNFAGTAGGGGVVYVPQGNYMIASSLSIPANVVLKGSSSHVSRSWGDPSQQTVAGTTLLAVADAGNAGGQPFITLAGFSSGVDGLNIFYPNQVEANPPDAYPWTIRCGDGNGDVENAFVQNVFLVNSFTGIDLSTFQCPRHWISNVYGQPLQNGIVVDQCYDIGRIEHIHFWPFWSQSSEILKYISENAFTFAFARTDWEIVNDVFSWGYHVGMLFRGSTYGACNGQFSNVNFDNVDVGIAVYGTWPYGIMFSNLNLANAGFGTTRVGIVGEGNTDPISTGSMTVRGASFWGNFTHNIVWDNDGTLIISESFFNEWNAGSAIAISTGSFIASNNFFAPQAGASLAIAASGSNVIFTSNMLNGNTYSVSGGVVAANLP